MNPPLARRPNRTIYHYTSLNAFLNIIKTGVIWATETRYLNDTSEIVVARDALNPFRQYWMRGRWDFPDWRVGEALIESALDLLNRNSWPRTYVSSFSACDDVLAQWNGYGSSGTGICFGLNETALEQSAEACGFKMLDCKYTEQMYAEVDSPQVLSGIHSIVASYQAKHRWSPQLQPMDAVEKMGNEFAGGRLEAFVDKNRANITMLLASIKHHTWKIEEEVRAISVTESLVDVCHRSDGFQLIPYRKLPLPKDKEGNLQIESICFWASPYPENTWRALESLTLADRIQTASGGRCDIRPSINPFRPRSKQAAPPV